MVQDRALLFFAFEKKSTRPAWAFALASFAVHAGLVLGVTTLPEAVQKQKEFQYVKVSEIPKIVPTALPAEVQVAEEKPKPPPPEKARKPRPREDERVKPKAEPAAPPPEVRAGINDSMALPGTGKAGAPAVAAGNSAEVAAEPEAARNPPPPPVPVSNDPPDPDRTPVSEAIADVPAKCPNPPALDLTDDAVNAGITAAEIVVDVFISSTGAVRDAILKKGTGYAIDQKVIDAAKKLICVPALVAGKAVAVKNRRLSWKVVYE